MFLDGGFDVLEESVEKRATYVVAKDYMPFNIYHDLADKGRLSDEQIGVVEDLESEYRDNVEATTESIREFLQVHDPDEHPEAFIPLQPPYGEHYREVAPLVEESHVSERYMLGGLKDASTEERIEGLLEFRKVAGEEPVAHGLGWGLSTKLVKVLREEPGLLDSVDNSRTSQIRNGKITDSEWKSHRISTVSGKFMNTVNGSWEFAMLASQGHRLTSYHSDLEESEDSPDQSGLGDFDGVVSNA